MKPGDVQQMASPEMVGRKLRQDHGAIQCPKIQSASSQQYPRPIRGWSMSHFIFSSKLLQLVYQKLFDVNNSLHAIFTTERLDLLKTGVRKRKPSNDSIPEQRMEYYSKIQTFPTGKYSRQR